MNRSTPIDRLERSPRLDRLSARAQSVVKTVVRPGPVEDLLTGRPLGHSMHPMLVSVPIGAWVSALVLDVLGDNDRAAEALVALGVLTAVPTGLTGAADWLTTQKAEQRVGTAHAIAVNSAAYTHAAGWVARRRGRRGLGIALSLAGTTLVAVGGWLGGHLSYAQGVGVDTTAFVQFPADWTGTIAESEVREGALTRADADGVPVLLTRVRGQVVGYADRCTHRGAPLHEGALEDGCVVCPWHGGRFRLADGSVASGPPTRPQPAFEVDIRQGRVFVRRPEERTLRTNPTGV